MKGNTRNVQQAKLAAQRLYKKVNYEGGNLQTYEFSALMQQTYDFLKIQFKPTNNDLKQYAKVLDANGDGLVSLQDLEAVAVNYLCGEGVLGESSVKKSVGFSQGVYSSSQNITSEQGSNKYLYQDNQYQTQNYGSSNYTSNNYQTPNQGSYTSSAYNYQNNASTYEQPKGSSFNQYGTSQGYGSAGLTGSQYEQNNYAASQQQRINQSQQHLQSKQSNQPTYETKQSKYTPVAQNYLTITRGLFKKYCNQQSNTITRDRVSPLLNETYSALGRKGYYPSDEDINVWMKLCDTNADGHVEQAQYQYFVVRALQRSGIQVNS